MQGQVMTIGRGWKNSEEDANQQWTTCQGTSEQTKTWAIENDVDMHSAVANRTDTEPKESSDMELGNL